MITTILIPLVGERRVVSADKKKVPTMSVIRRLVGTHENDLEFVAAGPNRTLVYSKEMAYQTWRIVNASATRTLKRYHKVDISVHGNAVLLEGTSDVGV